MPVDIENSDHQLYIIAPIMGLGFVKMCIGSGCCKEITSKVTKREVTAKLVKKSGKTNIKGWQGMTPLTAARESTGHAAAARA
jgi:hypothetical protein